MCWFAVDTFALCLSIFTVSFMDIGQMMPLAKPRVERQLDGWTLERTTHRVRGGAR